MDKGTQTQPRYVSVEREDLRALLQLARTVWRDHATDDVASLDQRIAGILDRSDEADRRAEVWRNAKCPLCGVGVKAHKVKAGYVYRDDYGLNGGPGHVLSVDGPPRQRPVGGQWHPQRAEFADEHTFQPCGHVYQGRWTPDMVVEPVVQPCEYGHSWEFSPLRPDPVCEVCGQGLKDV